MDLSNTALNSHEPRSFFDATTPCNVNELLFEITHLPNEPRSTLEILRDEGLLADAEFNPELSGANGAADIRNVLIHQYGVAEEFVQKAFAASLCVAYVDPMNFEIEREAINAIPAALARKHLFMPLCFISGGLVVALENPSDPLVTETLTLHCEHAIEFVIATRENIERAITCWYGPEDDRDVFDEMQAIYQMEGDENASSSTDAYDDKPVVRLVHNLLLDAIAQRASDIHIRPLENRVDLLFRLDGALVKMRSFAKSMLPAVVSRIKIIGNMDIAEHRVPQDGRFRIQRDGNDIDLRLSIIPMVQGESVVIRVLNTNAGLKSISELGFNTADADRFTELMNRSTGMVLVTGPTGCGKSTTLYAALQEVRERDVNIVTVEDPVEYRLEGVNQIQVNNTTGLTFARALRHILRHDPDVVMVGEIRDQETAKMAVESSLTGHLVLSTLHTNNAASAITRMLEIGIEPYLVKTSLIAVLAQRLVRRNCPVCVAEEPLEDHVRKTLGIEGNKVFYRGQGCPKCHGTGYSGRLAVYELLHIDNQVRELIEAGASSVAIEQRAVEHGMQPLTENALDIARAGITSLAEVYRVRLA